MSSPVRHVRPGSSIRPARAARFAGLLLVALALGVGGAVAPARAQPATRSMTPITVARDPDGLRLVVDGQPFMVRGMNWDYVPIGTNYNYSLWTQPDDLIRDALASEMTLLKRMGVNAIQVPSMV